VESVAELALPLLYSSSFSYSFSYLDFGVSAAMGLAHDKKNMLIGLAKCWGRLAFLSF